MPQPVEKPMSARPAFDSAVPPKNAIMSWILVLMANAVLILVGAFVWHRRRLAKIPALVAGGAQFCLRCGTVFRPGASFCHYCGASFRALLE